MGARGTSIVTKDIFAEVIERLCDGESLTSMSENTPHLPHRKTVAAYVQNNDKAYEAYAKARAIQGAHIEDQMRDIINKPLPDDPKIAMAEATWRRIKLDNLDKLKRQLQPLGGIRNNPQDSKAQSGTITVSWERE